MNDVSLNFMLPEFRTLLTLNTIFALSQINPKVQIYLNYG